MKCINGRLSIRPFSNRYTFNINCKRTLFGSFPVCVKPSALLALIFIILFALSAQSSLAVNAKKVVFIRYNLKGSPASAIINSFKKTMVQRGYLEGKNIEYVDFLTKDPGRESVLEILEVTDTHKDSADMFITTSWVSLYTRSKLTKSDVPQLFAPVLKSVALNMLPTVTEEPETNLSGVYLNYPPEKILRLARLILPGIKNYAYVFDSTVPADLIFKAEFSKLSADERHGIIIHFIDLSLGIDNALRQLKMKKIEAFGGVIGVFKNRKALARSGLPIITSLLLDVDNESLTEFIRDSNMIAGMYNSFEYCGEQAAEIAADIFDNKNTIKKTIPRPARQSVFVNMQSADRLNIPIPFTALEAVDFVIK